MRKPILILIAAAVALSMGTAIAGPLSMPSSPTMSSDTGIFITVDKKVVKKKKKTTTKKTNKNGKVTKKKTTTKKKTVNKHHNNHGHYRAWGRRPYYGGVVAGVTLGTVLAVSTIPVAPDPGLCWYWSNNAQTKGYWDYCVPR